MLFLSVTLFLVTLLLCYAGYVFLVVDRRQEAAVLEDPDLYDALDDKNYSFELPEQVDTYEDLRLEEPTDKCAPRVPPARLLDEAFIRTVTRSAHSCPSITFLALCAAARLPCLSARAPTARG